MARMVKRGWLTVVKEGNKNCYAPAIDEAKALRTEIYRFLDSVVGSEPVRLRLLEDAIAKEIAKSRR